MRIRWTRHLTSPLILGIALLVLTVGAYASAFDNGFVSDDHSSILKGKLIGSLRNLPEVFRHDAMWNSVGDAFAKGSSVDTYRPIPIASFFLEHAVWAKDPRGYHVVSIAIHVLNVFLVLWLGRILGFSWWAAFFAAALFGTNPSTSEAVHWINGRSDPLMMLFLLSGLGLWLQGTRDEPMHFYRGLAVVFLAFCATLCKETAFVLAPGLVVLGLTLFRAENRPLQTRKVLFLASPWIVGLGLGFIARSLVLGKLAAGSGSQISYALVRLPLVWRDGLWSLLYPSATIRSSLFTRYREFSLFSLLLALGLVLALIGIAIAAYRRRKPALLPSFVVIFLSVLAPVSILTAFEGWAGWGRYLYPLSPFFALTLVEIGQHINRAHLFPRWLPKILVLFPILFAIQTYYVGDDYHNERVYNLAQVREDPVGYLQVISLERSQAHPKETIPLLEKAVSLDSRNVTGWSLLSWCYLAVGDANSAYKAAETARQIDSKDTIARFVESAVLIQKDRQTEAAEVLLPLLMDDSQSAGLWREAQRALMRFGPGSAFEKAFQAAATDERYQRIWPNLHSLFRTQAQQRP